jgi:hypothetical protein
LTNSGIKTRKTGTSNKRKQKEKEGKEELAKSQEFDNL